jgi:hypothetical protein
LEVKRIGFFLATLLLSLAVASAQAPSAEDGPETHLFDTVQPLKQTITAQSLAARTGWASVPEDVTARKFTGSAVSLNDKLAVAFTQNDPGPMIYSRATGKLLASLALRPISALEEPRMTGWTILENSPSGVKIDCIYRGDRALRVRLTTGEGILELQSPAPNGVVEVRSDSRFTVVSDYFGDDVIYPDGSYVGRLPAENFCLDLLGSGEAILMTVWQSRQQASALAKSDVPFGGSRTIHRVTTFKDKNIWLAFLEQPGIWRARPQSQADDWRPPFPAKWRASYIRSGNEADSWDDQQGASPDQKSAPHTGPLLIYPIDRTPVTPLTATCPTDVMRNTLGVGPCQYILACEGMTAQGDPTPNSVMGWVEKQFEQKKQRKAADDIKERLGHMVRHIGEARARIERYAAFGRDARKSTGGRSQGPQFNSLLDELESYASAGLAPDATSEQAQQLADKVLSLMNQPNSLAACRELGEQLRAIGAVQDRALARCRMAVRRIQLQAEAMGNAEVQRLCEGALGVQ